MYLLVCWYGAGHNSTVKECPPEDIVIREDTVLEDYSNYLNLG